MGTAASYPSASVDFVRVRRTNSTLGALVALVALLLALTASPARAADYGPGDTGVVNVSKTTWMAEGEEPLAINPRNPLDLVAVSNTWQQFAPPPLDALPVGNGLMSTGLYVSNDGGVTWK